MIKIGKSNENERICEETIDIDTEMLLATLLEMLMNKGIIDGEEFLSLLRMKSEIQKEREREMEKLK